MNNLENITKVFSLQLEIIKSLVELELLRPSEQKHSSFAPYDKLSTQVAPSENVPNEEPRETKSNKNVPNEEPRETKSNKNVPNEEPRETKSNKNVPNEKPRETKSNEENPADYVDLRAELMATLSVGGVNSIEEPLDNEQFKALFKEYEDKKFKNFMSDKGDNTAVLDQFMGQENQTNKESNLGDVAEYLLVRKDILSKMRRRPRVDPTDPIGEAKLGGDYTMFSQGSINDPNVVMNSITDVVMDNLSTNQTSGPLLGNFIAQIISENGESDIMD